MRVFLTEPSDERVRAGAKLVARSLPMTILRPKSDVGHAGYREGLRVLGDGGADILVAGANVALSTFLPLTFHAFGASRSETLYFSGAPIRSDDGFEFVLLDPCVVSRPTAVELADMAQRGVDVYRRVFRKSDPFVGVLSHATGRHIGDELARTTLHLLQERMGPLVADAVLQVDAALSPGAAERKAAGLRTRPNVLLTTGVDVANAIYKTLEVFARPRVELSGAILIGQSHGSIGLLPRTCRPEQVSRLIGYCAMMVGDS